MDKVEEFHDNLETPLPSTLDGYVRKSVMFEFTEQYAQQISREFWVWVHKNKSHDQRLRYSFDELWNQWKLNQEESNEVNLGAGPVKGF